MEGSGFHREDAEIQRMNDLSLVPKSTGNVSIGAYGHFYHPLYFQLPPQFYGDRTSSYGGFLYFTYYGSFGHFYLTDCTPDSIYYSIFIKSDYGELVSCFFWPPCQRLSKSKKCRQIIFLTLKLSINFATAKTLINISAKMLIKVLQQRKIKWKI